VESAPWHDYSFVRRNGWGGEIQASEPESKQPSTQGHLTKRIAAETLLAKSGRSWLSLPPAYSTLEYNLKSVRNTRK
jgi:hypothetical protein